MPRKPPRNLRSGLGRISGSVVEDLNSIGDITLSDSLIARFNALDPGLGDELKNQIKTGHKPGIGTRTAREINQKLLKINARADAQAGMHGPVAIAKQGRSSSSGPPKPGLLMSDGRIGEVSPGIFNTDATNVEQVRSLFTCENFGGHVSGFPGWFEDCVGKEMHLPIGTTTSGVVHAMWGYTYEIPSGGDTNANDDPGVLELFGGVAAYWQYIVPVTTQVDRITWWNNELINYGPPDVINFALYDLNQADDSFPRVAETGIQVLSSFPLGTNTLALDSRITIDPGMYAIALAMPCHKIGGIFPNMLAYRMVNEIKPLPRYGTFQTVDGSMPDTLDSSNVIPYTNGDSTHDITIVGTVPLTYFDDSQEFAA